MTEPKLQLWFEFASTYSHLAVNRIGPLARAAGVRIEWKVFLLGPIFAQQGWNDSPFNIYPTKGRYMWRDMERLAEKYMIPFRRPTQFPRSGLLAARIVCASPDAPWLADFIRAVYLANFAEDRDIANPETIGAILTSLGEDAREIIAQAQTPEAKEKLRAQTEEASMRGIFGAPTLIVGDELFWGNDRLEDAIEYCRRLGSTG